ncbi:MAG: DUF5668 domain-containing protein [Chloroflexota bacterium]|nr:DUF5668 domain-containing protein [Chloroflexota bacterium]
MRARQGVFWPLLLIALGIVFLFSNFGVITGISWLAIASLWPLLLILIGLDIAFARRWPLPTLAAEILVIATGFALLAYSPNLSPGIFVFSDGDGPGVADVTVPRGNATELALSLNAGATRSYHVTGGATALVDAHSANPNLRVRVSGTTRANVRLDQVSSGFLRPADSDDIQIRVPSDLPTSITINVGAGEFDIDLSDVRLTDARVNLGASSMRFVLPKPTNGSVDIRMNGGASTITIVVPDGVEARIATTGGFLSLRSDNTRLGTGGGGGGCIACGSSIETSGYAAASNRVTVTISAGASSIVVR